MLKKEPNAVSSYPALCATAVKDTHSLMAATTEVTDAKATEVIATLRYWVRATNYQPNDEERQVLSICDDRAKYLWHQGAAVGAGAGFAATTITKAPMLHRIAVSSAFASLGAVYSQYRANRPCLEDLLELGGRAMPFGGGTEEQSESGSPLAAQAQQILQEGGAITLRSLQAAEARRRASQDRGRVLAEGPSRGPHNGSIPESRGEALTAHDDGARGNGAEFELEQTRSARPALPEVGDSWEAVRQRHRERTSGDGGADRAATLGWTGDGRDRPIPARSPRGEEDTVLPTAARSFPPRVRRNQYGDEIVE
jgi:hypothetical protein